MDPSQNTKSLRKSLSARAPCIDKSLLQRTAAHDKPLYQFLQDAFKFYLLKGLASIQIIV